MTEGLPYSLSCSQDRLKIDIEDVIIKGLKIPYVKINRTEFLQNQLFKLCPQYIIDIKHF